MPETKLHPLKTARTLVLGAALCAVVGLGCFLAGRAAADAGSQPPQVDAVVLQARLTEISQLAVVDYRYTTMAQFENASNFYGVSIPFTTKRFILTYDGEIKAGVDLERARVEVGGNAVTVHLPEAEILSHEIDADSVEIFDEKSNVFNPFTVEDFAAFQAEQKDAMEQKALGSGLLWEAQVKAYANIRLLLAAALPEGYTLTVRAGPFAD